MKLINLLQNKRIKLKQANKSKRKRNLFPEFPMFELFFDVRKNKRTKKQANKSKLQAS